MPLYGVLLNMKKEKLILTYMTFLTLEAKKNFFVNKTFSFVQLCINLVLFYSNQKVNVWSPGHCEISKAVKKTKLP